MLFFENADVEPRRCKRNTFLVEVGPNSTTSPQTLFIVDYPAIGENGMLLFEKDDAEP